MVKKIFFLICLVSFLLFFPSITTYFSHDDFFHLKISQVNNIGDVIKFFDLTRTSQGFGFYRPLTTQIFYSISYLFNINPLPLHFISFALFFAVLYLVFKVTQVMLNDNRIALISTFLYAISSTHFGHLYYLGAFQELGLALFFMLGILFFVKYLKQGSMKYGFLIIFCFVAALLSKESAVMFTPTLVLVYLFIKSKNNISVSRKNLFTVFLLNLLILAIYLYFHIFHYGLAKGDSYVWDFSPRIFNAVFWYLSWCFNLPEMLVDYIGPGFQINKNLFNFYANYITYIFTFFVFILIQVLFLLINNFKKFTSQKLNSLFFGICWFLITLGPFLFLPLHKFAYELTLPLFGLVLILGVLVANLRNKFLIAIFLVNFLILSIFTNILTIKTHWITNGGQVAKRVLVYINENNKEEIKTIIFYDTDEDFDLPWKPTQQLKLILSDNNFSDVLFKGKIKVLYVEDKNMLKNIEGFKIRARKILYL